MSRGDAETQRKFKMSLINFLKYADEASAAQIESFRRRSEQSGEFRGLFKRAARALGKSGISSREELIEKIKDGFDIVDLFGIYGVGKYGAYAIADWLENADENGDFR